MAFDPDKYLERKVAKAPMRESGTVMDQVPQSGGFDPDAYLEKKEPTWLDTKLPWGTARGTIQGAANALPTAGMVAGGVIGTPANVLTAGLPAGTIGGAGLGAGAGEALKGMIESGLLGKERTREEVWTEPVKAIGQGAVSEMGGAALGGMLTGAGKGLSKFAEKSAVNATGATGKQASEFADDAGRQLLDRKVVRFGDSQAKISERAGKAVEDAEAQISQTIADLDKKGVTLDAKKVYLDLKAKIKSMGKDPSKADIARMLDSEASNIVNAAKARKSTKIPIGDAENIKRGYNRKAGNWADPEKSMAGKEMYQQFRHGVEGAAEAADPRAAQQFLDAKKSYGLLKPIEESAARRASTTAQSPPGGLLDVSGAAAGGMLSGPAGAVALPVARRLIAPRMSSTAAVSADKSAKLMSTMAKNPQLLSGLIRLGLISSDPTPEEIEEGLMQLQQISGETP